MSEWKTYKLGKICEDIAYGYTESASKEVVGPKFLRITDIQYDFIDWDNVPYCPITAENHKKYKLEIGDIVIARTGASTGATAIFKDEKIDAVFASYLIRYKIKKSLANPFYIGHLLKSTLWRNYVATIIGGSAQPGANAKQFADFDFILPDHPTQTQIAQILTSLDDKIELNLQMNQTLEAMAQAVFKEWFVDFKFPGFDGELVNGLPKGWRMGKVGEIFYPKRGRNITKSEAIEGIFPVVAGGLEPSCYHNESNTKEPVVTISSSGANAGFVRLYHTQVWSSDSCFIDSTIYPFVYYCYIFLKGSQKNIYDSQEGSAQPHIYPRHIMDLNIYIGNERIVEYFENTISPIFDKIKYNSLQVKTLTQIRDTLLPRLMSGKIKVKA